MTSIARCGAGPESMRSAMIEFADSAEVFDNAGPGPVTIATFVAGDIVGAPRWPDWTLESLAARWPVSNRPR